MTPRSHLDLDIERWQWIGLMRMHPYLVMNLIKIDMHNNGIPMGHCGYPRRDGQGASIGAWMIYWSPEQFSHDRDLRRHFWLRKTLACPKPGGILSLLEPSTPAPWTWIRTVAAAEAVRQFLEEGAADWQRIWKAHEDYFQKSSL